MLVVVGDYSDYEVVSPCPGYTISVLSELLVLPVSLDDGTFTGIVPFGVHYVDLALGDEVLVYVVD